MTENNEVFPIEFRHEVVAEFSRAFIQGKLKLRQVVEYNKDERDNVQQNYNLLLQSIQQYFAGKVQGEKLNNLEHTLFEVIAWARASDAILEQTYPISEMDKKIANLEKRLDSTENLLKSILIILQKLVDKYDR